MSNARNLANLLGTENQIKTDKVADEVFQANDSLIINGDMAVAQRGTSSAAHTTGYGCVDRFKSGGSLTTGAVTMSQSTDAPDGFIHSLKMDVTTANTSLAAGEYYIPCTQVIEAQNLQHLNYGTSEAKPFVLSFWVKSNKTGTYTVEVYNQDSTTYINVKQYTIDTADTWEYKTLTYEANTNTAANIANDNGAGFYINWWVASGSTYNDGTGTVQTGWNTVTNNKRATGVPNMMDSTDNEWLITGVKLEVGDTATPFKHLSYADNLQQCLRYYWQALDVASTVGGQRFGFYDCSPYSTGTVVYGVKDFPVQMRTAPSFNITNLSSFKMRFGSDATASAYSYHGTVTQNRIMPTFTAPSSITAGRHGWVEGAASAQANFDAEL